MVANRSDAWALAHQNIEKALRKQKRLDKRSTKPKIKTGDRVMILFPNEVKGKSWKLARPYFGSFTVLSATSTNAEVKLLHSSDDISMFVLLDCVRLCCDVMTDDVWTGTPKCSRKKKLIPVENPKGWSVLDL